MEDVQAAWKPIQAVEYRGMTLAYGGTMSRFRPVGGKHFFFFEGEYDGWKTIPITARDLVAPAGFANFEGYPQQAVSIALNPNPDAQYLEVGAGLGEWVYRLAMSGKCKHRPIVIDPVDYHVLAHLIEEMVKYIEGNHRSELIELQNRVHVYADPNLVDHRKMTLQEAFEKGGLASCIDVVVDNYGPSYWHKWDGCSPLAMEKSFLRQEGILIYSEGNKQRI
ncbi:hypothetical protein HYV86_01035 [Candidatus Woesearchaeota archaeon]|nr:hypothetical protein [Candidatus Woesearchaeota archaeon]